MTSFGYSTKISALLIWMFLFSISSLVYSQNGTSRIIVGLTLVNTDTDTEITSFTTNDVNDDFISIDLRLYGNVPLTLRLDVGNSSVIGSVEFNLNNGEIVRTEDVAPYFLGGNNDEDAFEVNELKIIRTNTLTITVYGINNGNILEQRLFSIIIMNSSIKDEGTQSPTASPSSLHDIANFTYNSFNGSINGELKKWHKVTIGFAGPSTSETNSTKNPFTDYRFDVTFTHDLQQKSYIVPGYYACNGDAANSGASSGNVWLVHFRPDEIGKWSYVASFLEGVNVSFYNNTELAAMIKAGFVVSASFFDGASGSFEIASTDKEGCDFRRKGRLVYNSNYHYLQFLETGKYYIKAGADSPENFLAYTDFDNTPDNGGYRKNWSPHIQDYLDGDPTWNNGKGRGIIGAINYLSSTGMNAFSFLTMNINGDDKNVYPYISDTEFYRIDCSKTAQWDVVFDHAEHMGLFLHFKTQETENDQLLEINGEVFGNARKLYYRELIARFGHHLALNWNLGEENTNTDQQRKLFADYIKDIDPYDHPIVMHTFPGSQDEVYQPLLGYGNFDGVSLQTNPDNGFALTLKWVNESSTSGRRWIVSYDEQGSANEGVLPDSDDPAHDNIRRNVLWANLMAGGSGVEYYFGYSYNNSDLTLQDFRSRSILWDQSRFALEFFQNKFPFWNMTNTNERVSNNNWCLLDPVNRNSHIVVYLPSGGSLDIDLRELLFDGSFYTVQWYDPRLGGELKNGTITNLQAGIIGALGYAPYETDQDWAAILLCKDCLLASPSVTPTAIPTKAPLLSSSVSPTYSRSMITAPPTQNTTSPSSSFIPLPTETQKPSQDKIPGSTNDVGITATPTSTPRSSAELMLGRLECCLMLQFTLLVLLAINL